jgi:predicted Fe-Mo cluster-binding NifX family protein
MIIAFASKNHLGLNSDLGRSIAQSAYLTVVEVEGGRLVKVTNVENAFFGQENVDSQAVASFIASAGAERLVVGSIDNEDIARELQEKNVSVQEAPVGRIADLLKDIQKTQVR